MSGRITEKTIKSLVKPSRGIKIACDSEIRGFGGRLTNTGSASFLLSYSICGSVRRKMWGSLKNLVPTRKTTMVWSMTLSLVRSR
jgi:hypothetical protein